MMKMTYQSAVLGSLLASSSSRGAQKCTISGGNPLPGSYQHHHTTADLRTAHVVVLCISAHVRTSSRPVTQSRFCLPLQGFESGGTPAAREPSVTPSKRLPPRKQTSSSIVS